MAEEKEALQKKALAEQKKVLDLFKKAEASAKKALKELQEADNAIELVNKGTK